MKTLDEFLQLLKDFVPSKGGFKARCPAHADGPDKESWSLSVSQKDNKILVKCFAGCKAADIVKSLDLGLADLFLGEKKKKTSAKTLRTRKQIDKIYPYYDMTGKTLLFEVVRFKPKAFKQRRPDGKGGYIDNLEGVEPVPYRLPQILSAIVAGDTIHFPEGEKDADNLVKLNFQATTSPMGANAWKSKYATFFHGAKLIVIWADKDVAGRSFTRQKAIDLVQTAHAVKIIEPPGEKVKDISDWIDAGATAAQIQQLVDEAPLFEAPKDDLAGFNVDLANRDLRVFSDNKFFIQDFCFWKHYKTRDEEGETPLNNFVAKIIEDITKDNGADQERWLRIRGLLNPSGLALRMVLIPESGLNGMGWHRDKWGVKCRLQAGQSINDSVRSCIEMISSKAKERIIYTHSGWRQINGKWCYLTANGAIGDPDAECELEGRLGRYALPVPAGDPGESLKVSLAFLNVAKLEVTLPVWTAMYLAPLTPFEDTNFTLWYLGMTGSLKSTLEALALCHFGDFDHKTLPVSWGGTPNEIEHRMFILKDCVTVIDDWAPAADRNLQKEMESKSERILRAQANRAGKVRMRPDLGSQVTFDPRGLVITSGEQLPHGQSRNARLLAVPVEMTDFSMELLTQAQEDKEHYSMAMSHYIAWIQENWEQVRKEMRAVYSQAREKATTEGKHLRLVDIVAAMYSGLHIALKFMCEKKALTEVEVAAYLESGWTIFNVLAFQQDIEVNTQSPGKRFLEAIKTQLNSGRAVIRDLNENLEVKPGQAAIGWWAPSGSIYLNPGEAYQMVIQYYSRSGEDFTAYKSQTWQDLRRLHYLECDDNKPTRIAWINGRNVRVLSIIRKYILEGPQQEPLEGVQ